MTRLLLRLGVRGRNEVVEVEDDVGNARLETKRGRDSDNRLMFFII